VIEKRIFARGLAYHEVAIIRRMRMMGHPRDYIFSFLLRPGRKLTPACISEIENGQIGPDVEPATEREVDIFVARRLAESADENDFYGPLSLFQINEALGWFTRAEGDLLRDETQQVEFKLFPAEDKESLLGYAKTLAAFANNVGGYIFFGVTNERKVVGINSADFLAFDWDRFAAICRESFQPDIVWDRGLSQWNGKALGVLYAFQARPRPGVATKDGKGLAAGSIYYRYRGHTETIRVGDLFALLSERDRQSRLEGAADERQAFSRLVMREAAERSL
jgi:hypothetical protein